MQPLSPEPEPAAAAQPGACMWPASLPLLPPHPLIHAFSPRSCVEPHIGPSAAHPRTPVSPVRLEDAAPPGSSPASGHRQGCAGRGEGTPPCLGAWAAAATCSCVFVHRVRLLVSGVGRRRVQPAICSLDRVLQPVGLMEVGLFQKGS